MLKHHLDLAPLIPRLLIPAPLAICVLLVLVSPVLTAEQTRRAQSQVPGPPMASIESIVNTAAAEYLKLPHTAALSIGVIRKKQHYGYHFGTVDKSHAQRPSDSTLYPISSISKTFIGTLMAQAVLEGKLKLDDDIRSYLDGDYSSLAFEGQPIRLYHLLLGPAVHPARSPRSGARFRQ
jgi:CubicO group peptidase (beta-lactamase class C family)